MNLRLSIATRLNGRYPLGFLFLALAINVGGIPVRVVAQEPDADSPYAPFFEGMDFRLIGPFRGGRSAAVTGIPGRPMEFLFG
ncbi:MAG: hypothetical protein AAGI63_02845, partial [Planctomycetota bacterium]